MQFVRIFLVMILALFGEWGFAAPLPDVLGHTPLKVAANRGDQVVFAVALTGELGEGGTVKWFRYESQICEDLFCTIETHSLGLGEHKITMTLDGPWGTKSLVFRLSILAAPPGYRGDVLEPEIEMLQTTTIDVGEADLYLHAPVGRGFVRRGKIVYPVAGSRQPLIGAREMSCQSKCIMRFGRAGVEEQVILPKTSVQYHEINDGHRVYQLRKGAMRSRQLSPTAPDWSIAVDRHLQIDPSANADLLIGVRPRKKLALLTVLRGEARVVRTVRDKQGGWKRDEFTVPQGVFVKLPIGEMKPVVFQTPPVGQIQKLFSTTTPQYMGQANLSWQGDVLSSLPDNTKALMEQRDYIGTIQVLTSSEFEAREEARRLMLAKAFAGVFQYDRAKAVLQELADGKALTAGYYELSGTIAMAEQRWEDADGYLDDAVDDALVGLQRLHYYKGVTAYQLDHEVAAETDFKYALWHADDLDVRHSTEQFLRDIDQQTWGRLKAELGILHELNVSRGISEPTDGPNIQPGHGAQANLRSDLHFVRERNVGFDLTTDVGYTTWLQEGLASYAELIATMRAPLVAGVGGTGLRDAIFGFGVVPLATYSRFGETNPYETVGADIWMGSPSLWGIRTLLETRITNDLGLGQLETFDPVLMHPVDTTDRTNKSLAFGLGISPVKSDIWEMEIEILQRKLTYRAAAAQSDSHSARETRATLSFRPNYRWRAGLSFANQVRLFDNKDEGHTGIASDVTWYLTPNYSFSLRASLQRQTSSDEDGGYDMGRIGLWSSVEL